MHQRIPLPRPGRLSRFGSIAAIGILFHLAACSPVEPAMQLQIGGSVLDAQTEVPVADARVRLMKLGWKSSDVLATATTNGQGDFSLGIVVEGYCPESLFYIEAEAEGYASRAYGSDDASPVRCTDELQRIDFMLEPEG